MSLGTRRIGGDDASKCCIGCHVVRREVKVGGEVKCNGNVVEPMGRHGVLRLEYGIKVMCVPVVANERVHREPQVGLEGVSL
eukprot:scaffold4001_cov67-Attheya_sp.AAC.2